jgi:hypothetical protein
LKSSEGALDIEGSGIKIDVLDTESGVVKLTGRINALYYENGGAKEKRGLFHKAR